MFSYIVRVLQYRSVAFVTYVNELNGQFAKEAMACQSLDNDEILNVRWATEDPNPTSKVAEKRRLEEMGREAIQARMDPRIIDAMRAVRALEDGEEAAADYDDDEGPDAKRPRLEIEEPLQNALQPPPQAPKGLLSADTLEGLKYFAEIRKRTAPVPTVTRTAPIPARLGLGDYGSDDDD
jgi:hypothetical protein